jgi:uncharacterized membrane protein YfcA
MSLALMSFLWGLTVATAMLSGVFGMAGGLLLIGVLLVLLPLPAAMALHAVTQIASNAWRAAFGLRHVRWRIALAFGLGSLAAMLVWSALRFVPSRPFALIALGLSPFVLMVLPARLRPDAERASHGALCGAASMSLMLMAGVSGPLLDRFFLGGQLGRHAIVATKAVCQVQGHALKLLYFGALIAAPGALDPLAAAGMVLASLIGTVLAQPLLAAMSDATYRRWAGRIVTALAAFYLVQGGWLLLE